MRRTVVIAILTALWLGVGLSVVARASGPGVRIPLDSASSHTTSGYTDGRAPPDDPAFELEAGSHLPAIGPGRFDNAFTFDGSDQQGLDYQPSGDAQNRLSPPDQLTVAAWVKATNPGVARIIVQRGVRNCGGVGAWSLRTGDHGGLEFYAAAFGAAATFRVERTPEIPASSIWDGEWHAVAGVFDGGADGRQVVSLWIDGRQASAADLQATNESISYGLTEQDLLVARGSDNDRRCFPVAQGFPGSVDEIEIFDNALSARRIGQLQDAGATTPPFLDDETEISRPTMSGTPKVGDELTCADTANLRSISYAWERAPRSTHFENDANWFEIDGASGSTYTVQPADAGSRVRCHVYGNANPDSEGSYLYADRASTSQRADNDVPINTSPPSITGTPIAGQTLTCNHGNWDNGPEEGNPNDARFPGDFRYQWFHKHRFLDDNQPIEGATNPTYQLSRTTRPGTTQTENAQGDGGTLVSCVVYAKNDVGQAAPAAAANPLLAVDGKPIFSCCGGVTLTPQPNGDPNPLHRHAECSAGFWQDDYARYPAVPGYEYRYVWYRQASDGTSDVIAGATGPGYDIHTEDLGRTLRCRVSTSNVAGASSLVLVGDVKVGLPDGPVDSVTYREDGLNGADPTSLLPVSKPYLDALHHLIIKHLQEGLSLAQQECRDGKGLNGKAIPDSDPGQNTPNSGFYLSPVRRCQILLHAPIDDRDQVQSHGISVYYVGGVRYRNGKCTVIPSASNKDTPLCHSLGIQIPSIDPTHPPTSGDDVKALEPLQPKQIIWDIDDNGTADAICPGSAPVLRTILQPGKWHPRAILVGQESDGTAIFHFAGGAGSPNPDDHFNTSTHADSADGTLRANQVRVCGTSFDPPPDPSKGPCVTNGDLGRVHVTGNLCPVDVRALDKADYEDLLGGSQFTQLRDFLLAASEDRLKNESGVTVTHSARGRPEAPVVWTKWGAPSGPRAAVPAAATATYENTAAALAAYQSPGGFTPPSLPNVNAVKGFVDSKAGFALDQLYVTHDPIAVNGVTQSPQNGSGALLVPSSVGTAVPTVDSMVLAARDASSHLGLPNVDGIPLATGGLLNTTLSDVPHSPDDVLRETNLTDVANQLRAQNTQAANNLLSKLDLGPFKLDGAAKIHLGDEGTASIEVDVKLPALTTGGKGTGAIAIHARLYADTSGKIALRGLHLGPVDAYLGALNLSGLDLTFDSNTGFLIKGKILFPPQNDGLAVNKFQIDQHGTFQALDVDYLAGAGLGINVGPGMFLTTLGGGLDLPRDTIDAHAVLSMGPSTGGGCPTAGLDGRLLFHFAEPFSLDSNADVKLACIRIANTTFHADSTGLITLNAHMHFPPPDVDLGPVYFDADIGGAIRARRHAAWQVTAEGKGGIRDLLTGDVQAALSNAGFAGCGSADIEIPLIGKFISLFTKHPKKVVIHLSGGASVDFDDDVPPLNTVQFLANLHLFTGCDIGSYRTVTHAVIPRGLAAAGGFAFTLPRNSGATLLSIEGAGSAPRIQLRSPTGQVYDFSSAVSKGQSAGHAAWGKVLESEDRTVVLLGDPPGGRWTATPVAGSARVLSVRSAAILPKPAVKGHVTGRGVLRTLSYSVSPISGQVVRFFEFARRGQKLIKTVRTGGRGRVRFLVSEASGSRRSIVAEVTQDSRPRGNLTVARYTARSPRVGRPVRIRARRRGKRAVVTWGPAFLGQRYEVTVRYGDGRSILLVPGHHGRARQVVVLNVRRGEGLRVGVRALSPTNRRGAYAYVRLSGNLHVGRARHLPRHHKKHRAKHRKRHR